MAAANQIYFRLRPRPVRATAAQPLMTKLATGEALRVLRVAHASLTPALRARERALVECFPEIDLAVVTTARWPEAGVEVTAQPDELFSVTAAQTYLSQHIQLFAYDPRPLIDALRCHRPHLIDLNHEPYSVACAEVLWLRQRYAPQAAVVMQTAQNLNKRYPPPFAWLEQRAFRQVDAAYVCSATVRERLRAQGFTKPVELIPFGVDAARFAPRPVNSETHPPLRDALLHTPVIGFAGRMLAGKGLLVLTQALQRIAGENWRALFVGDGPRRELAARQLATHGLAHRVTLTGAVPYEKMPEYLAQMDILVVPSQTTKSLREQFGRVIVEAMASGVCVVGSRSGAIPEVIGDAGLLVPEGDADALAHALRQLLHAPALRLNLAQRGRQRVAQNYTWERVAEKTAAFYQQVLTGQYPER